MCQHEYNVKRSRFLCPYTSAWECKPLSSLVAWMGNHHYFSLILLLFIMSHVGLVAPQQPLTPSSLPVHSNSVTGMISHHLFEVFHPGKSSSFVICIWTASWMREDPSQVVMKSKCWMKAVSPHTNIQSLTKQSIFVLGIQDKKWSMKVNEKTKETTVQSVAAVLFSIF